MPQRSAAPPATATAVPLPEASQPPHPSRIINVAVQGCCHGELNKIYAACQEYERETNQRIDLLLCCGDFQSLRSERDFSSLAVPPQYRTLGDFHEYASGQRVAPMLTLFVGGNHEASNVLWSQYYGGFVAPNIYYLGHSGCVWAAGLRIVALSGIFKSFDFRRPYPLPPYNPNTVRQAYHVREFEIQKLSLLEGDVDIVVSHDWPTGITCYGDVESLLRVKPYLAEDIRHKRLGNPHTMALLQKLRPRKWFAAHYHCKFEASVPHFSGGKMTTTDFLALDKCVRGPSEFLAVVPMQVFHHFHLGSDAIQVHHDSQWLRIVRATHSLLQAGDRCVPLVSDCVAQAFFRPTNPESETEEHSQSLPATTTSALMEHLKLEPNWFTTEPAQALEGSAHPPCSPQKANNSNDAKPTSVSLLPPAAPVGSNSSAEGDDPVDFSCLWES